MNPSAPTIQLHDYIIKSSSGTIEPTYDIMNKAKECLQSNGVDPNTVSKPDKFTLMVASAPEFGSSVSLIILVSILMVTLINRRSIKSLRISLH